MSCFLLFLSRGRSFQIKANNEFAQHPHQAQWKHDEMLLCKPFLSDHTEDSFETWTAFQNVHLPLIMTDHKMQCSINTAFPSLFCVLLQYFSKSSYIITTNRIFLAKKVSNVNAVSKQVTLALSKGTETFLRHHLSCSEIDYMNICLQYLLSIHCGFAWGALRKTQALQARCQAAFLSVFTGQRKSRNQLHFCFWFHICPASSLMAGFPTTQDINLSKNP